MMHGEIKNIRRIDLIAPFSNEIRQAVKDLISSAEWLMRFAATFIGLGFVGLTFAIGQKYGEKLIYTILFSISFLLLIVTIFISMRLNIKVRPRMIFPTLKKNSGPHEIASNKDIEVISEWTYKNYVNLITNYPLNRKLINKSYWTLSLGIFLLGIGIIYYVIEVITDNVIGGFLCGLF